MKHTKLLALSVIMGMGLALGMYALYAKAGAAIAQDSARLVSNEPDDEDARLRKVSKTGHDITPLSRSQVEKLASKLDEETYRITQKAGTEPAHCGTLLDNKREGVYSCVVCGLPLFSSEHKFDSGSGWPSFYREYDPEHVKRLPDDSIAFMPRVEIECARCDAHLGHVFEDGPKPTGERHCLNSASLVFTDKDADLPTQHTANAPAVPTATETAYFAGGCFWGIEHYFQKGEGVIEAVSGYMQGRTDNPTYKEICYEDTGHAEAVKVVFDPTKISYEELLKAFFIMHDPTQLNRQGPDFGTQYRSGIYYVSDEQKEKAEAFIKVLTDEDVFKKPIVTEIEKAETFWEAEDYHQDYILKTGRACHVRNPWN